MSILTKHIMSQSEIKIQHGPKGYTLTLDLPGRVVLIEGQSAYEVLSKAGVVIDDIAIVVADHTDENQKAEKANA